MTAAACRLVTEEQRHWCAAKRCCVCLVPIACQPSAMLHLMKPYADSVQHQAELLREPNTLEELVLDNNQARMEHPLCSNSPMGTCCLCPMAHTEAHLWGADPGARRAGARSCPARQSRAHITAAVRLQTPMLGWALMVVSMHALSDARMHAGGLMPLEGCGGMAWSIKSYSIYVCGAQAAEQGGG